MLKSVFSSVAIVACLPLVIAAQESVALDLQIYVNGTLVGSPTIRVAEDETGSVRLPDLLDVAITPSRQDGGRLRVALEFAIAGDTAKPVIVIDAEHPGVLKIPSPPGDEDEVELRIGVSSS